LPATRAYELWIEQSLLRDRLAIRVGQQAADVEFFDSRYDDVFANSALGWPGITGINLPGGGPSPPLAVPGVRVKATLSEQLAAYVAVFDGYPASPGTGDAQIGNPHGVLFRVNDPPWVIGQLRYGFDAGKGHPAKIVVGGWKHFGSFDDMRFGANGRLLADPLSFGLARKLNGNWGLYAVYEQLLTPAVAGSDNGIGFFFRASASPGDRNLISLYLDGGLEFIGVGSARPNDKIGIGVTYARISDSARQADSDIAIMTGSAFPRRDYEAVIELTYAAQVSEHCVMQPIFEYVIHPGGGILNPYAPAQRIKNAAVFGFRTTITY
jgi:porin